MSSRRATTTPYDDERWRSSGTPSQGRSGPHLGPIRITPARVFLVVALFGGLGFLAYSIFFRDALQVPLMASGFAVVGIVLGIAAFMSIGAVVTAGREQRDGAAFFTALFGGFLAVGSLMCLAAAVIMSMIWSGTSTT
jgi:hypothetical protein